MQLLRIARRKPDGINIEKITSVKNRKKSAINSVINVAPARKGAQREQIKRIHLFERAEESIVGRNA